MTAKNRHSGRWMTPALFGIAVLGWLGYQAPFRPVTEPIANAAVNPVESQPAPFPIAVTSPDVTPSPKAAAIPDAPASAPVATAPASVPTAEVSEPIAPTMADAGFDSTPAYIHSNRLLADWHQYDRVNWSTSPWISLLTRVVDPMFSQHDGWHLYNPDTLDGMRDSVRRPASLAISGGLKFSRSF